LADLSWSILAHFGAVLTLVSRLLTHFWLRSLAGRQLADRVSGVAVFFRTIYCARGSGNFSQTRRNVKTSSQGAEGSLIFLVDHSALSIER
jgi:hypothetical protein